MQEVAQYAGLLSQFPGQVVGSAGEQEPQYHLFHAPNSVCSQKVRAVFLEAEMPFASHIVDIFAGENYDPHYVKTRALACREAGLPFAASHFGSTSVVSTGCDACVVPTVIDTDAGRVLVDSLGICIELSRRFGGSLRPPEHAGAIDSEIAIVDGLPNYPLLASKVAPPAADGTGNAFAMGKVARCNGLIEAHSDDTLLVDAYTAKRDKELSANTNLFSPAALRESERGTQAALVQLAARLPENSDFLFGDRISLADIFWAIMLIRNDDLGYGHWMTELPRLKAYYDALCATPSIRKAVIDWPGARIRLPSH